MRFYGNLNNRFLENCKGATPEVGMGVTECMWSDRNPYEIIAVKDDRHITIRRLDYKRTDKGGFSECQEYEYYSNERYTPIELFKNNKGRWVRRVGVRGVDNSSGWYIGRAERYYDFTL